MSDNTKMKFKPSRNILLVMVILLSYSDSYLTPSAYAHKYHNVHSMGINLLLDVPNVEGVGVGGSRVGVHSWSSYKFSNALMDYVANVDSS